MNKTNNKKISRTNKKLGKKGQITVFIILALVIIVIIAIIFLLKKPPKSIVINENNPQAYIDSCTREAVEEAITILSMNGGDIIPKGSVLYDGRERTYLCYNSEYYKPCINQRPMLIEHIESLITNYTTPKIANCFNNLQSEFEGRYDIEIAPNMEIKTKLQPKQVSIEINRDFKMTRKDATHEFKSFKVNILHPIYDLAKIATEITNQESKYCNFDNLGYMIIYPDYEIKVERAGSRDEDKIYIISERVSEKEFVFAIRSCLLPPGL